MEASVPRMLKLEWLNRGGILIRRINSERIAEDPRIKYYYVNIEEKESQFQHLAWQSFMWKPHPETIGDGIPREEMQVHWTAQNVHHLHHNSKIQLKQEDLLMQISPR